MKKQLIYLEGEKKPFAKEDLADMIIDEATGKDEGLFSSFVEDYADSFPWYLDKAEKLKRLQTDLDNLKAEYKSNRTWYNPDQIKSDIISRITPLHPDEFGNLFIPKRIWKIHIDEAINLSLAVKKKMYLTRLLEDVSKDITPGLKIKWNRNISEFGFMMNQLVKKGYITMPPGPNSDSSISQFAKILYNCFDINGALSSLEDALNEDRNYLRSTKRAKLEKFPDAFPNAYELRPTKNVKDK
jgi:hypothetical protein